MRLALTGAGFIGKWHALAMHAVGRVLTQRRLKARPFIIAEAGDVASRI